MAIIEPTIDHIDDQTVMLELRNLAGAVDKNEKALNDEMASIQESQTDLENKVNGFQDSIDQNTADITTIKGNIQTIEEDITTIEKKNTEQDTSIQQNTADITTIKGNIQTIEEDITFIEQKNTEQDTAIQQNASDIVSAKTELNQKITAEQNARESADSAEATARANADIDLVDLTYSSGGISIKLERPEGDLEDTVYAPFIKTATLIPTTTNRAFKIQFDLYDGTQYDTNEFVIPEGGGTDVSVTGVTISAGTSPDSFKVNIELSDGTPIASNDYPFPAGSAYPTSATLSMSGTTISISIAMSVGQPLTGSVDIAPALANYATKAELSELTGQMMNTPQNVIGTVTTTQNGLMTFSDKVKLNGIAPNANNYVLPIGGTNIGGVKNGGNVTINPDGTMHISSDSISGNLAITTQSGNYEIPLYGESDNVFSAIPDETIPFNRAYITHDNVNIPGEVAISISDIGIIDNPVTNWTSNLKVKVNLKNIAYKDYDLGSYKIDDYIKFNGVGTGTIKISGFGVNRVGAFTSGAYDTTVVNDTLDINHTCDLYIYILFGELIKFEVKQHNDSVEFKCTSNSSIDNGESLNIVRLVKMPDIDINVEII